MVDEVLKPASDFKSYRHIELPNGLRAMLVSSLKPGGTVECTQELVGHDEGKHGMESQKSAAALCINVGYFSDPMEVQGLAHLLEHMVLSGSEKYPAEEEFESYIDYRDGSSDACTEGDYTLFFFNIQRPYFKEALDRLANFFIAPLLRQEYISRGFETVHGEFNVCKSDDSLRLGQLMASLANVGSPYHSFGLGNRISLRDKPIEAGINVYELLREFHLKYYNASLMTLAVESEDTLDNLQTMVTEIFGSIPNRNCEPPNLSAFANPFPSTMYRKIYKVCPVKDTVSISFIWSLPSMYSHYKSAALRFVASIVEHQGRGSLMAYLRKFNLATKLRAGCALNDCTHHNQMTSLFGISVDLSELGRTAPSTVADYIFAYLRMLREVADFSLANPSAMMTPWGDRTFAALVPEFASLWALNFHFRGSLDPYTNVQTIAVAMRKFPPYDVFSAESLLLEPDLKAYVEVVHHLTPDKVVVTAFLPEFNIYSMTNAAEWVFHKEPWFDIRYAIDEISDDQIRRWQNSPALADFHLPEVNRFIATDFGLLPEIGDNEVPVKLDFGVFQLFGELWYQQSVKFYAPTAHVTMRIYSDLPQRAKDAAILRLWWCALNQRLQTVLCCAKEAGLSYSVSALDRGLEIAVAGFNEKLFLLYKSIVDVLVQPLAGADEECLFNERSFAVFKDRLRQMTCDRILDPCHLSTHLKSYFQDVSTHLLEDSMKALESLTIDDILVFIPAFFTRLYVKAFVYGNVTATGAKEYMDYTLSTLKPREVAVLKPYPKAALPACLNRLRVMNFDKTDVNTSLVLISPLQGTPSDDLRYEVMNKLLESCLQESAFVYLRLREKLGYSLGLYSWSLAATTGQCGLSLAVRSQANRFETNLVAGRMYAFWYRIMPYIVFHLKEEAFQASVEALLTENLMEDRVLNQELSRNLNEVFSNRPVFDRRQRWVEILRQLKLSDLQDFYIKTYYDLERQPTLMIQVDSLSDVVSSAAFSKGGSAKVMTTFDWPLCVVPMSGDQEEEERFAALAVDVREEVRLCAPALITDDAKGDPNADYSIEEERAEVTLPRFVEILEVHDFKDNVLFASQL
ncbi:Nardilysin [Taenia crassiceps]|uniref:Nardilysin n=1 Tax=Taenia crassiceps TaxID=6207 RepID=A0ABR4Q3Y3_9CEST